jgi:succinate dehydrogenase / fumarate reductase iron-sulfur subunit
MSYDATFKVWRGDAEGGDLQDFTVEVNEGEVVLDIIHRLQATQAPDLAVRWNCKASVARAAPRSTAVHGCCA